jgi:hypothetical protein
MPLQAPYAVAASKKKVPQGLPGRMAAGRGVAASYSGKV